MSRPVIYIAGPISRGDLEHNINQAIEALKSLAMAGFAPWCPQLSCFSSGAFTDAASGQVYARATTDGCGLAHSHWIKIDLTFVERSDAVLRLFGESVGADAEVEHARGRGIPVFNSIDEVLSWYERKVRDGARSQA